MKPVHLNDALLLARFFERELKPLEVHIALGGSCLHTGFSSKDVDLIVYPRYRNRMRVGAVKDCIKELPWLDILKDVNSEDSDYSKPLLAVRTKDFGIRIDFLFVDNIDPL